MSRQKQRNPYPTVDVVVHDPGLGVLLIRRRNPPHGWALPGGFVDAGESFETAAVREAREETGLDVELTGLLGVYSGPDRDPRFHTASAVYAARAADLGALHAADDAAEARFFPLHDLPPLVFDHAQIIEDYLASDLAPRSTLFADDPGGSAPVLITLGDPGGLGPELVRRHFAAAPPRRPYLVLGPACALDGAGFERLDDPARIQAVPAGVYVHEPAAIAGLGVPPGGPTVDGGRCAGESLSLAVELLRAGVGAGVCTCPLNKAMLQAAGFDFPGHTEFLAEGLGVGRDGVCMHLCGPRMGVSLVTTHPPLAEVPGLITRERVLHRLRLTARFAADAGAAGPIAVCGLNPHAGESGRIGREEIEAIAPAIEAARAEGIDAVGPIPADTLFHFAARGAYAAVLAMYHDQGLGPLKLLHFSEAVNVTLGLPVPRTSPDHGTGYDLVGTGRADIASFSRALRLAGRLAQRGHDQGETR